MVLKTDRLAIQAAIKTCHIPDYRDVRLMRIKNTLEAHRMEISENLFAEARANPKLEILSDAYEWDFKADGNLW